MKKIILISFLALLLGSVPEAEYKRLDVHKLIHLHERLQKEMQKLLPDCAVSQIIEKIEDGFVNYYGQCLQEKEKEKDNRI